MFHPTVLPWWWFKVDRKDENQTDGRRDERRRLKLGRREEREGRELPTKFQPSPLLRLSVTPLQRMAGEEAAAAKAEEADGRRGPRRKRSGGTGRGKIGTGKPIEEMIGWP